MIVIVAPYQVLATPPNSEGHWQDFRGCSGWTCWWQTWVPWVRPRQAGASSTLGRFRPCVEAGIPASWAFSWALVLCSLGFSQVTSDQKHAWVMVRLCSGWLRDPRTWCAQACVTVTWGQVGLSRPRQVTWVVVHPVGCPPPHTFPLDELQLCKGVKALVFLSWADATPVCPFPGLESGHLSLICVLRWIHPVSMRQAVTSVSKWNKIVKLCSCCGKQLDSSSES